ncbi:MAG TPA: hypothetical protein VMA72_04600 [Streptosporangiaceae bacterium]|nr:hypothetical protein [Streptosporangiaceae bacterium]
MTTRANASTKLTHIQLTEPFLTFDPLDAAQKHLNPLAGLAAFGPYSAAAWKIDHHQVRVAILAPYDAIDPIRSLLNELRDSAEPRERRDYLPPYPGFKPAFRAALVPAEAAARQPLPDDLDRKMAASAEPHIILARALTEGLGRLAAVRSLFDVAVFYLPHRWERSFVVGEFDLHDHVKAAGARLGLPTQIVTDQAMSYRCRASVRWRLATALYAKAGGVPYKLASEGMLDPGAAYVGLAYGIRDAGRPANSFVVCCSQLFDGQGGGLEFVAHDVSGEVDPRNPYLSRPEMRSILSRSLNIYADRHAGRRPSQLIVHKAYPFTDEESRGAAEAWGRGDELTCVSLTKPAWRGVQVTTAKDPKTGRPRYGYAVDRGTLTQLDDYSALLWVNGNAAEATLTGRPYLQGGKGTPRPLLLTRHVGRGPLAQPAAQILALSKMDWNTDALYRSMPATIIYAQLLAKIVKHETLAPVPYDYRLFM